MCLNVYNDVYNPYHHYNGSFDGKGHLRMGIELYSKMLGNSFESLTFKSFLIALEFGDRFADV
jgi:hypothetical protein